MCIQGKTFSIDRMASPEVAAAKFVWKKVKKEAIAIAKWIDKKLKPFNIDTVQNAGMPDHNRAVSGNRDALGSGLVAALFGKTR